MKLLQEDKDKIYELINKLNPCIAIGSKETVEQFKKWAKGQVKVFEIPDNVSDEEASLAEPIATCIRAQNLSDTRTGDNILIIGAGSIGSIHVSLSKLKHPNNIIVSDISDENYGNFVGYACEFSEKLSNLSGFTVCANALVECNATNTEKEKIKELLENGVYL